METRIMIAGSGGQGILFLGKMICQAALDDGRNVTWFPSYGAEMRGGTANCTVIISNDLIGSPVVKYPDFMIIMNNASLKRFLPAVRKDGTLLYDSSLVDTPLDRNDLTVCAVPSTAIAGEIGNPRLSNMVLLGAFIRKSCLITKECVIKAVRETVPSHRAALVEKNIEAIERGAESAQN